MNKKEEYTSTDYLEKSLSKMLKADMDSVPEVHISPEELIALAEEDRVRRRRRFVKYASVAAVFILICTVVLFAVWPGGAVPADAGKDKETQVDKDGNNVIVKGENADGENGNSIIIVDDWDKIKNIKDEVNGFRIPEYYPTNFKFEKLTLDAKYGDDYKAEYCFYGDNNSLLQITLRVSDDAGEKLTFVEDKNNIKYLNTSNGKAILYRDNRSISKAVLVSQNNTIKITTTNCNLSDKEYKDIFDGLKVID